MIPPFDILMVDAKGHPRWLEAASSLDEAKARVQEHMKRCAAEYLIFSQKTGNKISIKPEGAPADEKAG
jgi:hypothetical protein